MPQPVIKQVLTEGASPKGRTVPVSEIITSFYTGTITEINSDSFRFLPENSEDMLTIGAENRIIETLKPARVFISVFENNIPQNPDFYDFCDIYQNEFEWARFKAYYQTITDLAKKSRPDALYEIMVQILTFLDIDTEDLPALNRYIKLFLHAKYHVSYIASVFADTRFLEPIPILSESIKRLAEISNKKHLEFLARREKLYPGYDRK